MANSRADAALANIRTVTLLPDTTSMTDNMMVALANAGFNTGSLADRYRAYMESNLGPGIRSYTDGMKNGYSLATPIPIFAISELV